MSIKTYIKSQLVEPTAWLCVIIAVSVIVFPTWFTLLLCVIGIAMDEAALKAWCERRAPGISKWLDEWVGD